MRYGNRRARSPECLSFGVTVKRFGVPYTTLALNGILFTCSPKLSRSRDPVRHGAVIAEKPLLVVIRAGHLCDSRCVPTHVDTLSSLIAVKAVP